MAAVPSSARTIELAGSTSLPPDARAIGPAPPRRVIDVTVVLCPPSRDVPRSRALTGVRAFARANRLRVVKVMSSQNIVYLSGTTARLNRAFGVTLKNYASARGNFVGHSTPVRIPASLSTSIDGVIGLSECRIRRVSGSWQRTLARKATSYYPHQMARFYNFPEAGDGRGQTVALIELGGGFEPRAVRAYFRKLKLRVPSISVVGVDGARNRIAHASQAGENLEVQGDIETLGSVAPGARIVVYFAPLTDRGLYDALSRAVNDRVHRPSIISVSFGQAEEYWSPRTLQMIENVLQLAAARGITVCCAVGDSGSSAGVQGGRRHVFFPASSPHVLACGGTQIRTRGNAILEERVWRQGRLATTGGGVSRVFAAPSWQSSVRVPPSPNRHLRRGRGIPDVSANAADYLLTADGETVVIGGTSAVAPLWAGLLARINQLRRNPVGFVTPALYIAYEALRAKGAMREIVSGSNGAYRARRGWNPCTGLGSPDGAKLAEHLSPPSKPSRR